MTNYIKEITSLQEKVQKNKEELIRLEEQEKNLKAEKNKLLAELKELNINFDDLEDVIESQEKELNNKITKIEKELE